MIDLDRAAMLLHLAESVAKHPKYTEIARQVTLALDELEAEAYAEANPTQPESAPVDEPVDASTDADTSNPTRRIPDGA